MKKDRQTEKESDSKSNYPLIISGIILAAAVLCYFIVPSFKEFCNEAFRVLTSGDRKKTSDWVMQFGFWGPLVLIFAQVIQMFLFIVPTVLLMIVSILAYGPLKGSVIAMAGIVLASVVAYGIGLSASGPLLDKLLGRKTRSKMKKYVDRYGAWLVVIARVNPVLSNDTVSFVSGIVRLNFMKFMVATLLATVPLLVLISYLGENTQRLKTGMYWITGVTLVMAMVYYGYRRIKGKPQR